MYLMEQPIHISQQKLCTWFGTWMLNMGLKIPVCMPNTLQLLHPEQEQIKKGIYDLESSSRTSTSVFFPQSLEYIMYQQFVRAETEHMMDTKSDPVAVSTFLDFYTSQICLLVRFCRLHLSPLEKYLQQSILQLVKGDKLLDDEI